MCKILSVSDTARSKKVSYTVICLKYTILLCIKITSYTELLILNYNLFLEEMLFIQTLFDTRFSQFVSNIRRASESDDSLSQLHLDA